jgi:hypothetical protein
VAAQTHILEHREVFKGCACGVPYILPAAEDDVDGAAASDIREVRCSEVRQKKADCCVMKTSLTSSTGQMTGSSTDNLATLSITMKRCLS